MASLRMWQSFKGFFQLEMDQDQIKLVCIDGWHVVAIGGMLMEVADEAGLNV